MHLTWLEARCITQTLSRSSRCRSSPGTISRTDQDLPSPSVLPPPRIVKKLHTFLKRRELESAHFREQLLVGGRLTVLTISKVRVELSNTIRGSCEIESEYGIQTHRELSGETDSFHNRFGDLLDRHLLVFTNCEEHHISQTLLLAIIEMHTDQRRSPGPARRTPSTAKRTFWPGPWRR